MKRTIFFSALALLISAGITAQSTNQTQNQNQSQVQTGTQTQTQLQDGTQSQTGDQSLLLTRKRDQLRLHDQTGAGDQIRKRDQTRFQDPACSISQTGTQVRNQNASQARRLQVNDGARANVMNRNMRMSTTSGARRR